MSIAPADLDVTTRGPEAGARSEDYLWTLNFGPQHPATHTTLRLVLKLEGERVVDALPEMGYLHSGFEKIGEHLTFNQYVTVTDRMNYISPIANNVAWHHAVEALLGLELTPRCTYIRTIVAELARISDHLLSNGAVGLDTGAFTFFLYAFYQREVIYDIFETLCGARFTNSYTRVGGVSQDFTPLVIEKIRTFVRTFPKTLDDMERLLTRNRIFVDRTRGVGVLTREEAIARGATGPVALRLIASSFVSTPTPFVRSTKILLRVSSRSMSSSVFGKVLRKARIFSITSGVKSCDTPPTRVYEFVNRAPQSVSKMS